MSSPQIHGKENKSAYDDQNLVPGCSHFDDDSCWGAAGANLHQLQPKSFSHSDSFEFNISKDLAFIIEQHILSISVDILA